MRPTNNLVSWRRVLAIVICTLILGYTVGVVSGHIPNERKIDAVHLAIIALGLLAVIIVLRPETFERLKLLEITGFKLEMLERVREKQARQESQLEDITLMLPLLLPEKERKHLLNLDRGRTSGYEGNGSLRAELRRLRSISLIRMLNGRHIGHLTNGSIFDLADYIQLTELGKRWVRRIEEIEKTETSSDVDKE